MSCYNLSKYCCIFDITHRQAGLVQRAIESYSGDWKFSKSIDSGSNGAAVTYYSSRFVKVMLVWNPDKILRTNRLRIKKSYVRLATAGYRKDYVSSFLEMLEKSIPEIKNNHKVRQLGVENPKKLNQRESIERIIEEEG